MSRIGKSLEMERRSVVVWGDGRNRTEHKWAQGRKKMGETMST